MMRTTRMAAAAMLVAVTWAGGARAAGAQAPAFWTDWITAAASGGSAGTASGTIMVGGTPVTIGYAGEFDFAQTTGGTNYWQPRSTFLGTTLTDAAPITADLIAISETVDGSGTTAGGGGSVPSPVPCTPMVKPFQNSPPVVVKLSVLKVPSNMMVPFPSVPSTVLAAGCVSGPPPKMVVGPPLTIVNGELKV